jgi:hypothetical protein
VTVHGASGSCLSAPNACLPAERSALCLGAWSRSSDGWSSRLLSSPAHRRNLLTIHCLCNAVLGAAPRPSPPAAGRAGASLLPPDRELQTKARSEYRSRSGDPEQTLPLAPGDKATQGVAMDFKELIRARYSCRADRTDPVEEETLAAVLEAAHLALTATNRQAFNLYVLPTAHRQECEGT